MRIGVLEHERESPAGLLAAWARERGHVLDVLEVPALAGWPEPGEHDVLVSLGSDCSVHASSEPWIAVELELLRRAHARGVPLLGICFGAQALAAALGGTVRRAARVEPGWRPIATADPALIPAGPWFRWHEDVFTVPPGGVELARAEVGPLAFARGRSVGVQFHPEVDAALADAWIAGGREQLLATGADEARLRAEVARAAPGARERAFDLFDRLATRWRD